MRLLNIIIKLVPHIMVKRRIMGDLINAADGKGSTIVRQHVQRHYEKNGTKSHRCKLHKRNWRRPWRIDISMRGLGLSIWGRSWMRRLLLQLSWGRNSTGSWVNLTTTILSYTDWSLLSLLKLLLPYVALAFKKSLKDLFKWTKCFEVFTRNSRRIQLLRSLSVALAACLP